MKKNIIFLVGGNENIRAAMMKRLGVLVSTDLFPAHDITMEFSQKPSVLLNLTQQETLFSEQDNNPVLIDVSSISKEAETVVDTLLKQAQHLDPVPYVFVSLNKATANLKTIVSNYPDTAEYHLFSGQNPQEQALYYLELFDDEIELGAQRRIASSLGKELGGAASLVQELLIQSGATKRGQRLTTNEVNAFLHKRTEVPASWDFTDAIDNQHLPAALGYAHTLYEAKSPYFVYTVIQKHFSLMRQAYDILNKSESEIMQVFDIKGSPYPIKKAKQSSQKYGDSLYRICELIEETGLHLRSRGTVYAPIALDILIARLTNYPRKK